MWDTVQWISEYMCDRYNTVSPSPIRPTNSSSSRNISYFVSIFVLFKSLIFFVEIANYASFLLLLWFYVFFFVFFILFIEFGVSESFNETFKVNTIMKSEMKKKKKKKKGKIHRANLYGFCVNGDS